MQIVIDVPEYTIKRLEEGTLGAKHSYYDVCNWIGCGTPLPKGHGDLIDRQSLTYSLKRFAPEDYTALIEHLVTKEPAVIEAEERNDT